MRLSMLLLIAVITVSPHIARASCDPNKLDSAGIKACFDEVVILRSELNKKPNTEIVIKQCSGNCDNKFEATAQCPTGKKIESGIWYYSVPDAAPNPNK